MTAWLLQPLGALGWALVAGVTVGIMIAVRWFTLA
jgi:hypothetical protein